MKTGYRLVIHDRDLRHIQIILLGWAGCSPGNRYKTSRFYPRAPISSVIELGNNGRNDPQLPIQKAPSRTDPFF